MRKTREFPPSLLLLCFLLFRKSPEASCFAPTSFLLFCSHPFSSCLLLLFLPFLLLLHLYCAADLSSSFSSLFFFSLLYPVVLAFSFLYFSIFSTILSISSLTPLLLSPFPPVLYIHFTRSDRLTFSVFSSCLFHSASFSHRLLTSCPSQRTQFLVPALLSAPLLVFSSELLL